MKGLSKVSVLVENIQRFSLHDGEGIRTTVFLKGCSLRCPWCANPENLHAKQEYFFQKNRCIAQDGFCALKMDCPAAANKLHHYTQEEAEQCPLGAIRISGKDWNSKDLAQELLKDRDFFCQGGGVTFSGGEPLLWAEQLSSVWDRLHEEGIDLCCESCLFVPEKNVRLAAKKLDRFLVDVKTLDQDICSKVLHGDLSLYLKNLDLLFGFGKPIVMRFPLVPGITAIDDNIQRVGELVKRYRPERLEIFSVHNLAESKYMGMGYEFQKFKILDDQQLTGIQTAIRSISGIDVQICHL